MKRRKGLSGDEKREKMLAIFHEKLDVFNLKEVEKWSVKAGIIPQSVKEVLDLLVADSLVDSDKIGIGNFYWSFPSQMLKILEKQTDTFSSQADDLEKENRELQQKITLEAAKREENKQRKDLEKRIAEDSKEAKALAEEIQKYERLDPKRLEEFKRKEKELKAEINEFTDNVFAVRSWMLKQNPMISAADLNKMFEIPEEFDNI